MNNKLFFTLLLVSAVSMRQGNAADNEGSQRRFGANGHGRAPAHRGGGGYNGGGIRRRPAHAALGRNGGGVQRKLGQGGKTLTPLWLPQPKGARKKAAVNAAARAQANAALDAFLDAFKKQDLQAAAEIFKSFDTPAEVAAIVGNASKANMVALISTLIEMLAPFITMANAAIAQQKVMATQGQDAQEGLMVMQEQNN